MCSSTIRVTSLAASSPDQTVPCDLIVIRAPNPGVAGAVGKQFGWDPMRSSLLAKGELGAPGAFSRPGDLMRDFRAWAELHEEDAVSPSGSRGSDYEIEGGELKSTNSDEKNMSLFYAGIDDATSNADDEMLVMLIQWSSRADAERFKHPLQKSLGQNGQEVSCDVWDRHVAHPVRQLQDIGAEVDTFKLELRGVEERIEATKAVARERSGSRRLSVMAAGISEKVTGLWR